MMRRIVVANKGDEVRQFLEAVDVADRAVIDDPVAGASIDGVAYVVADRGAIHFEPKMVGHIDVARLQHVHRPRVHRTLAFILRALGLDHFLDIGPPRHPGRRQCPAHEYLIRMDRQPSILVLVIEIVRAQRRPGFLEGDVLHPVEDRVRHLGPSIREPLPCPVGRVLDHIFAGEKSLLRAGGQRREQARTEHHR